MSVEENEDTTIYKVVVNHEEQYSIWPADRENALGWSDAGKVPVSEMLHARYLVQDAEIQLLETRRDLELLKGKGK